MSRKEPKFISIGTSSYENENAIRYILFALDDIGNLWQRDSITGIWKLEELEFDELSIEEYAKRA